MPPRRTTPFPAARCSLCSRSRLALAEAFARMVAMNDSGPPGGRHGSMWSWQDESEIAVFVLVVDPDELTASDPLHAQSTSTETGQSKEIILCPEIATRRGGSSPWSSRVQALRPSRIVLEPPAAIRLPAPYGPVFWVPRDARQVS